MRTVRLSALVAAAGLAAPALAGGPVPASLILMEGDALAEGVVSTLNTPFTDGAGRMGTVVALADARRVIFYDGAAIFNSDDALPDTLTGGESTMGIGNAGQFIYSPSFNGFDAAYGESGLILADGDPAPGYATGFFSTFNSRPQMINDGSSYWIGGINDGLGGTTTFQRALYTRSPAGVISIDIACGDTIPGTGLTVAFSTGVDFDYHNSGDGAHAIRVLLAETGSTTDDGMILADGTVVARELSPSGDGDNWDNFDQVAINASGNYIFSGDTDGATSSDEFIAYNASVSIREGDSVGGLTLGSSCNAASLNDLNEAVFVFSTVEESETLFYAADAADMASAVKLLSVGDSIDVDGDTIADWIVSDFNASNVIGPGLDLAENGVVYVEVDLDSLDLLNTFEAIIRVDLPGIVGCSPADLAEPFGSLDFSDVVAFLVFFGANDPAADLAEPFGQWDFSDVVAFLAAFGAGCF